MTFLLVALHFATSISLRKRAVGLRTPAGVLVRCLCCFLDVGGPLLLCLGCWEARGGLWWAGWKLRLWHWNNKEVVVGWCGNGSQGRWNFLYRTGTRRGFLTNPLVLCFKPLKRPSKLYGAIKSTTWSQITWSYSEITSYCFVPVIRRHRSGPKISICQITILSFSEDIFVVARSTFLVRLFWQLRNNRNGMLVSEMYNTPWVYQRFTV